MSRVSSRLASVHALEFNRALGSTLTHLADVHQIVFTRALGFPRLKMTTKLNITTTISAVSFTGNRTTGFPSTKTRRYSYATGSQFAQ